MSTPTLSGAQNGKFKPWREVPGGICLISEAEGLRRRPCAVRIVSRSVVAACQDYARQYLSSRGDKVVMAGQLGDWATFFLMHQVVIEVPQNDTSALVPMFPLPPTLTEKDGAGKLNFAAVGKLGLCELADGQMPRLANEYELLKATETPDRMITHAEWEALITEGKDKSLATLLLQHGSSRLIQLLHGIGEAWPE